MRTVIFDLDGTLADTSGDLIAAANACFRALGEGDLLDPANDVATAFAGGKAMLSLGFERLGRPDPDAVERLYPVLLGHYGEAIDVYTTLYPGAVEAVEALRAKGFKTGICTNKPEALAQDLMTRLGVRDLFGSLIGADTLAHRKPHPAPYIASVEQAGGTLTRSLLVGDTATDRETARAAGVASVLVTFGAEGDRVAALAPEALLPNYQALLPIVEKLLP
ncbi:MAG: HAD-IA family hydrolase [Pseudomonadota bacterium]